MYFNPEIITQGAPYGALALILIILLILIVRLEYRMRRLLRGKNAESLEESIVNIQKDITRLLLAEKNNNIMLKNLDKRLKQSIRGLGVVRFNPFKGTSGSNQSFAVALLNEEGDGAVLSSLYSRERVSSFAKPIKNKTSEYELTPEEKEAINKASNL